MTTNPPSQISPRQSIRIARRVTWVGFWINAILGVAKIIAGILGRSGALIADGVHSFSDFASDLIVLLMVGISRRKPDTQHPFGHGKYETLATIILSAILIAVAGGIFWEGLRGTLDAIHGNTPPQPGLITLAICLLSILAKEWLYHYTVRAGRRIHSDAVIANAWHHRSDAFSSIATLIGIAGAIFLGPHWRILDPLAAMTVAVFIAVVGVRLAMPATRELLGVSLPPELLKTIQSTVASTDGVITYHHLRTAKSGADYIIDIHLKLDPTIPVTTAHSIATAVETNIRRALDADHIFVNTHIEPYLGQPILPDGSCAN